jgi:hypothetical protein
MLTKNGRNFRPVGYISAFKRPNHYSLYTEHSARWIKCRIEPNMRQNAIFRRFWQKVSIIIVPSEMLRRFNAQITTFYMQNILHAEVNVETGPRTRVTRYFVDCATKCQQIFFPLDIFRRLKVQIIPLNTNNIAHATISVETNPTTRITRSFVDFDQQRPNFRPVGNTSALRTPN